ncbi:MAG: TIGR01777 family oxidoreductase [Anaerolineales bacterium]
MNLKTKHILIIGGSGLLGRALTDLLVEHGDHITILSRNPDHVSFPTGVQVAKWDGRTTTGWESLVEVMDVVVNLAGHRISGNHLGEIVFKRWTSKEKTLILSSRVDTGHAIVQAIQNAKHKPEVLLQASAVGYYGPRGNEELDEDAPSGNDFISDVCRQWEASTEKVVEWGIRRVVMRIGLVFTAHEGFLPVMTLPFRLFVGGKMGDGEQYLSWIHIKDTVMSMRFLIDNGAGGIYNLSAPSPVTNAQFSKLAGRFLHRPNYLPLPEFVLKLIMGEKATLALHGQRVIPRHLVEAGYSFQFPELEAALESLLQ